jgi:glycerol-3-phosphate cytidylyltransferase
MKRVLTYGTFDLFHHGHVRLLRRLAELGDELYVGCSTDAFNALKGKKTALPFRHRVEVLQACRYVTHVFAERNWRQKARDVRRYDIDVFGMGGDWQGKFDELGALCHVVYLPRTEDVSTSEIKETVYQLKSEQAAA